MNNSNQPASLLNGLFNAVIVYTEPCQENQQ
jgi:hypothetical protein